MLLGPWIRVGCFVARLFRFEDLDPILRKKVDKWGLRSSDYDRYLIIEYQLL